MHVTQNLEKAEWAYSSLGCDLLGVLYYFDTKEIKKDIQIFRQVHFTLCQISKLACFLNFSSWLVNNSDKKQNNKQTKKPKKTPLLYYF